jgi:hypothetical protein
MHTRSILVLLFFGVVGATLVAVAQPPLPAGNEPARPESPAATGTPAATAQAPAAAPAQPVETPLAHFSTLEAFPTYIQSSVRSVLHGANWLTRMHQPNGRCLLGLNPALRQPLPGENDLYQARAALAMARAARFAADEKMGAMAAQSILALLTATRVSETEPGCRVPVNATGGKIAMAATLALAIMELPQADARLLLQAEELCEYLHRQCRADGSVGSGTGTDAQGDPDNIREYPGVALHAIMLGNRFKPAPWKSETVKKGLEYYRALFRSKPNVMLGATLTPAAAELYLQTRNADVVATVYELNDWICRVQIQGNDPRLANWAGAFRLDQSDATAGPETGLILEGLSYASQVCRLTPDLDRHTRYRNAATEATQFLITVQYLESNTRHFENTFRSNMLIGGFHLSPLDGNIRLDATATAVSGLLRYLQTGDR